MKKCFFCDVQKKKDKQKILENNFFFSRFDGFPISKGHSEIVLKNHTKSFFDLSDKEISSVFELLAKTKKIIDDKFHPDAYNVGFNDGKEAGQSIMHLHIHLIPRYKGDVKNPKGGVRNILFNGDYTDEAKKKGLGEYIE